MDHLMIVWFGRKMLIKKPLLLRDIFSFEFYLILFIEFQLYNENPKILGDFETIKSINRESLDKFVLTPSKISMVTSFRSPSLYAIDFKYPAASGILPQCFLI